MANKRTAELSQTQPEGSRAASPATSRSETSSSMSIPTSRTGRMSDQTDSTPGSKASSPSETPKNQIDFHFLNFSHPSDAKASRARRAVRSHVTRQQHKAEHAAAAARRAKSFQQQPTRTEEAPTLRAHAATFPSQRPASLVLQPTNASSSTTTSSPEDESSPDASPVASPTQPLERRVDPSELYPEEWHPYVPRVMVCERHPLLHCSHLRTD